MGDTHVRYYVLGGNVVPIRCNLSTLMGKNRYKIQDVCEKTGPARGKFVSNLYHDKITPYGL